MFDFDDDTLITIAVGGGFSLFAVAVIAYLTWSFVRDLREDPNISARRGRALIRGLVTEAEPFELVGVASGQPLCLVVDLDFSVPWGDIVATISQCGLWLEFELWYDTNRQGKTRLMLPRDRFPRNARGKRSLTETQILGGASRSRCACLISNLSPPAGTRMRISGRIEALPESTLREVTVWVG